MSIDTLDKYDILPCKFKVVDDDCRFSCLEAAQHAYRLYQANLSQSKTFWYKTLDYIAPYSKYGNEWRKQIIETFAIPIALSCHSINTAPQIQDYINKNYRVITANVENLEDADVICIGECHASQSGENDQIKNGHVIDALYKEGDLALIEQEQEKATNFSQIKYVTKDIKWKGWDIDCPKTSEGLQEMDKYKENPEIPIPLFVFAGILIGLYLWGSNLTSLKPTICVSFLTAIVVGMLMNTIHKTFYRYKYLNAYQKIVDDIPQRNRNMFKTIDTNATPGKKIFVLSGFSHFVPGVFMKFLDPNRVKNFTPYQTAFDETIEFLQKRKFAILVPK